MIEAIINPIIVPMSLVHETQITEQIPMPFKEATRAEQKGKEQ